MNLEGIIMLLQFRIKNYKSIGEEVILDMTAGNGKELEHFVIEKNGVRILPIASIYGGNASGKSNVIEALYAFVKTVNTSTTHEKDKNFPVTPFLFDEYLSKEPTEFEIHMVIDEKEYKYGYIATKNEILEEWLYEKKLSKSTTNWKEIFEREKSKISYRDAAEYKKLDSYSNLIGNKMLALSFLSKQKINVFSLIYQFIGYFIYFDTKIFYKNAMKNEFAKGYFKSGILKSECVKFIKEFDPTFEDFIIKKELDAQGENKYKVFSIHNKKEYPLDIESEGSQKIFWTFIILYLSLNTEKSIIIFDELDCQLHPLILRRIVRMFHDKNINKTNSQLIFTSHNLIILDNHELRRDEIWFTEKDEKGLTSLYSLADFKTNEKDIRADLNYGKHYLAGRFGAIPYMNYKED